MCAQYGGGHQEILCVHKALLLLQRSWMRVLCPAATATCPNIHTHPAIKKGNTGARPAYNHNMMHDNTEKPRGRGRNLQNV